jgi:hypothetical protein
VTAAATQIADQASRRTDRAPGGSIKGISRFRRPFTEKRLEFNNINYSLTLQAHRENFRIIHFQQGLLHRHLSMADLVSFVGSLQGCHKRNSAAYAGKMPDQRE